MSEKICSPRVGLSQLSVKLCAAALYPKLIGLLLCSGSSGWGSSGLPWEREGNRILTVSLSTM